MNKNTSLFRLSLPRWSISLLGLTGVALLLSGIVCFFAYNWEKIGLVLKFSLPLLGLLGCAVSAYFKGLSSNTGKVLSFSCGIFIGIFWAVYGQVYQTGSFVYEFLGVWALCLLPLALLAGNRWIWVLWAGLLNGYCCYLSSEYLFWQIFLINTLCFAFSERAYFQKKQGPLFSLFFLIPALWACLINGMENDGFWVSFCLVFLLAIYAYAKKRGSTQLGLCAFVVDCLLIDILSSYFHFFSEMWINFYLLIFGGSGWAVYMLTSGQSERGQAHD